jgi:pyridoxal phosphate enzyme (YggS family)
VSDADDMAAARIRILERVTAAAGAGRDPAAVQIVAITKTVPPERILAASAAGFGVFGENRVQERAAKVSEIDSSSSWPAGEAPHWHLVGPLQSNKARRAVELFDVIETVDSLELAERLSRIAGEVRPGRPLPVLLQVNVDDDDAKSGYQVAALERDLSQILDLPGLTVGGLMTVGRLVDRAELARPTFAALRVLSERLRARDDRLGQALSMGMSDDYPIAVEEGATIVRIGRAIFGERHGVPR